MSKKKIIGLCLAMGLMVGIVGGSLAWFTDTDTVTNSFSTGSDGEPGDDGKNGLVIVENFDQEAANKVLPGATVTKAVQTENRATYSQYIRVKLKKVWKNKDGQVITQVNGTTLNPDLIELDFGSNVGTGAGKWTDRTNVDGYYYYNTALAASDGVDNSGPDLTNKLLENVKLSDTADNLYKGLKFDVIVEAESIQSENGAADDAWGYTPGTTK